MGWQKKIRRRFKRRERGLQAREQLSWRRIEQRRQFAQFGVGGESSENNAIAIDAGRCQRNGKPAQRACAMRFIGAIQQFRRQAGAFS
jgi:hypothetical protein